MSEVVYETRPPLPRGGAPRSGCLGLFLRWLIMPLVFCFGIFMLFLLGLGLLAGSLGEHFKNFNLQTELHGGRHNLRENVVVDGDPTNRVALIAAAGVIDGYGNQWEGEGMVQDLTVKLRAAAEDDTVKTVLLTVNSPGGGLTASDVLHHEILRVQARGKNVIVHIEDLAASGGYYISAPANYIVAQPTSIIGSFGVIMQHFEIEELLNKIGVRVEPLKSTDSKDIGSMFRPMTEEERAHFEKILNVYHERFVDIIAAGRKLDRQKIEPLATGELYTAPQALELKLIDKIGYFDDTLAYACEKTPAEKNQPEVFIYEEAGNWRKLLEKLAMQANIANLLPRRENLIQLK